MVMCRFCNVETKNKKFCSRHCKGMWQKENLVGKNNPNYNKRWGKVMRKQFSDKITEQFRNGRKHWSRGLTNENSEKKSISSRKTSMTIKRMHSDKNSVYNSIGYRNNLSKSLIGRKITWNDIMAESGKRAWKNMSVDEREKRMEKWRKSIEFKPSKLEITFSEFFKMNNLPFLYTGDGSFWIGRNPSLNPDFQCTIARGFIEVGNKKFKTVFGGHWKKGMKKRRKRYRELQEKVFFLWEDELKNPHKIKRRVENFVEYCKSH